MAEVILNQTILNDIANAIREKTGTTGLLLPNEYANAIGSISYSPGLTPTPQVISGQTVKMQDSTLTAIANAVRSKLGTNVNYYPQELAAAIRSIPFQKIPIDTGKYQVNTSINLPAVNTTYSATLNTADVLGDSKNRDGLMLVITMYRFDYTAHEYETAISIPGFQRLPERAFYNASFFPDAYKSQYVQSTYLWCAPISSLGSTVTVNASITNRNSIAPNAVYLVMFPLYGAKTMTLIRSMGNRMFKLEKGNANAHIASTWRTKTSFWYANFDDPYCNLISGITNEQLKKPLFILAARNTRGSDNDITKKGYDFTTLSTDSAKWSGDRTKIQFVGMELESPGIYQCSPVSYFSAALFPQDFMDSCSITIGTRLFNFWQTDVTGDAGLVTNRGGAMIFSIGDE